MAITPGDPSTSSGQAPASAFLVMFVTPETLGVVLYNQVIGDPLCQPTRQRCHPVMRTRICEEEAVIRLFVQNSWMGSLHNLLLPRLVSGEVEVEGCKVDK